MGALITTATRTPTALKRWSASNVDLPPVERVREIHVYDFDNTLFRSPIPNPKIWAGPTLGKLSSQNSWLNLGWWHEVQILERTGKGMEYEEEHAWEGHWDESIVDLVRLSIKQPDALCVLLTGRKEARFTDIVSRMVKAKGLAFDMLCLKPEVAPNGVVHDTTMAYKTDLLTELVHTYLGTKRLNMYEDRPNHTKAFQSFFDALNAESDAKRSAFEAQVHQVVPETNHLDPVVEVAEVQRMVNETNQALNEGRRDDLQPLSISRRVICTGYLVDSLDTTRLHKVMTDAMGTVPDDLKPLADVILVSPRPYSELGDPFKVKAGEIGRKLRWRVTGLAELDEKLWAARVKPIDNTAGFYTHNKTPAVILGLRAGSGAKTVDVKRISNWQAVQGKEAVEFETVLGEKISLEVVDPTSVRETTRPQYDRPAGKRYDNNRARRQPPGRDNRQRGNPNNHNRVDTHSRRNGGPSNRGRGRGMGQYRSLDDNFGPSTSGGMQY